MVTTHRFQGIKIRPTDHHKQIQVSKQTGDYAKGLLYVPCKIVIKQVDNHFKPLKILIGKIMMFEILIGKTQAGLSRTCWVAYPNPTPRKYCGNVLRTSTVVVAQLSGPSRSSTDTNSDSFHGLLVLPEMLQEMIRFNGAGARPWSMMISSLILLTIFRAFQRSHPDMLSFFAHLQYCVTSPNTARRVVFASIEHCLPQRGINAFTGTVRTLAHSLFFFIANPDENPCFLSKWIKMIDPIDRNGTNS